MFRLIAVVGAGLLMFEGAGLAEGRGGGPGQGGGQWGGPGHRGGHGGRGGGRGGRGGHGGGPGMMGDGGPMKRCGKMLLRAHPDMLKEKLGLSDDQISNIRTARNAFLTDKVKLESKAAEQRVRLRILFEEDLPNEGKVLDAMRKARNAKGQMMEAAVKTQLKLMRVLTPEQRKEVRKKCHKRGRGDRYGKAGKRGFGKRGFKGGQGVNSKRGHHGRQPSSLGNSQL